MGTVRFHLPKILSYPNVVFCCRSLIVMQYYSLCRIMFFNVRETAVKKLICWKWIVTIIRCFGKIKNYELKNHTFYPPEGHIRKYIYFLLPFWSSWSLAETVKSQARKPKCSKGYHCSRNAYMLVYKVQEEEDSDPTRTNVEVPGGK